MRYHQCVSICNQPLRVVTAYIIYDLFFSDHKLYNTTVSFNCSTAVFWIKIWQFSKGFTFWIECRNSYVLVWGSWNRSHNPVVEIFQFLTTLLKTWPTNRLPTLNTIDSHNLNFWISRFPPMDEYGFKTFQFPVGVPGQSTWMDSELKQSIHRPICPDIVS